MDGVTKGEALILLLICAMSLMFASRMFVRGIRNILDSIAEIISETESYKRFAVWLKQKYAEWKVSSDITTEE